MTIGFSVWYNSTNFYVIDSNYIQRFSQKLRNAELDVVYGVLFLESISNLIIKTESEQF